MNAPFFVPTNTRILLMISPVWVVINSFSILRRTNITAQDNFPEINCERATVLTETPSALNQQSPSPRWGESDATLAHRMGEGLGVRASGEVNSTTNVHEG